MYGAHEIRRIFNVMLPLCDIPKHRHVLKDEEHNSQRASVDAGVGHPLPLTSPLQAYTASVDVDVVK